MANPDCVSCGRATKSMRDTRRTVSGHFVCFRWSVRCWHYECESKIEGVAETLKAARLDYMSEAAKRQEGE